MIIELFIVKKSILMQIKKVFCLQFHPQKSMSTTLLWIFFFISIPNETQAYFRGGEILWNCTQAGNFRFVMNLYRDCGSPNTFPDTLWLTTNASGFDSIGMVRVMTTDKSPFCDCMATGLPLNCSTATQYGTGAIEEIIYSSDIFYPSGVNLTGVPPPTGWHFVFEGCCRAPTDNLGVGTGNFALVSTIYPFLNFPINTCFDNSPSFLFPPVLTGCAGDPHALFQVPKDIEIDSLRFELLSPLLNATSYISTYQPGYSSISPLPGPTLHPGNQTATFDPTTGDLLFTSYTPGAFALAIRVSAWKCGAKVAEIHREVHILVILCQNHIIPVLNIQGASPYQGIMYMNDTVFADELIIRNILAENISGCGVITPHDVALYAFGSMYGFPMNNSCLSPPCAQLTPVIPQGGSLTDSSLVNTIFNWQTAASHLTHNIVCSVRPTEHDFVFIASNKVCPVPAVSYGVLRIALKNKALDPPIPLTCISILPNGDVNLQWSEATDTTGSFSSYQIRHSTNLNGPFTNLVSIYNKAQTSYVHQGANAQLQPVYYQLLLHEKYTGGVSPVAFDTVGSPTLSATASSSSNIANLTWNSIRNGFLSTSSGFYEVYRELQPGNWVLIGTTSASVYSDTLPAGTTFVRYRIALTDTVVNGGIPMACFSISNVAELIIILTPTYNNNVKFHIGKPVPNPASEKVMIPLEVSEDGNLTIFVADITGKKHAGYNTFAVKGSNEIKMDVASWLPGIYFCTLHFQGMKQTVRIQIIPNKN